MHMREKGKRPLLSKRTPSGRESRASCQGTTFHFPDMRLRQKGEGGGGGPRGACVSRSAWDSLARRWEEHVVLILSMGGLEHGVQRWHSVHGRGGEERGSAGDENALTPLPLLTSFIHWAWAGEPECVCVCLQVDTHTHIIYIYIYTLLPRSTAAKGKVTGVAKSIQPVSWKVSNEEIAVSPWTLTAVPSLLETRPHMEKTNTAAQTCKLTPHAGERGRFPWKCNLHYFHFHGPGHET